MLGLNVVADPQTDDLGTLGRFDRAVLDVGQGDFANREDVVGDRRASFDGLDRDEQFDALATGGLLLETPHVQQHQYGAHDGDDQRNEECSFAHEGTVV